MRGLPDPLFFGGVKVMGRIPIIFDEDVEIELRNRAIKKGDLSRIVNDALRTVFLMKAPKK